MVVWSLPGRFANVLCADVEDTNEVVGKWAETHLGCTMFLNETAVELAEKDFDFDWELLFIAR
ncbi:MAG: hypothetical protein NZ777_13885, partial [Pseudomonadales bacterium]|nr:hypothetical protein [Pseudomonadales bacterium]